MAVKVEPGIEIVTGEIAGKKVSVTVGESNALAATKRYRMITEGAEEFGIADASNLEAPAGADQDVFYLRVVTYPNLMSVVREADGFDKWPITFEQFCNLPEQLWKDWQEAVFKVNPSWFKGDSDPKVPTTST